MKKYSITGLIILVIFFVNLCYSASQKQTVYELQVKYIGKGTMCITTSGYYNVNINIDSKSRNDSLFIKQMKGLRGITQPYTINVNSVENKLSLVNVNLGKISFGKLNLVCHDVGTISTKNCSLSVQSDSSKSINYVYAHPGILHFDAPNAKINFLSGHSYVGDPEKVHSMSNIFPKINIKASKINIIRLRNFKKYQVSNWISQVSAKKINKIIGSAVSHIFSENNITAIKTYSLSGLIMSGTVFSENNLKKYQKGDIKRIRAGAIFDCHILAGVPPLLNGAELYYDTFPAFGKIMSVRAESTQNTHFVSRRKIHFGWLVERPIFSAETFIWENQKLGKLKLRPIKKKY